MTGIEYKHTDERLSEAWGLKLNFTVRPIDLDYPTVGFVAGGKYQRFAADIVYGKGAHTRCRSRIIEEELEVEDVLEPTSAHRISDTTGRGSVRNFVFKVV